MFGHYNTLHPQISPLKSYENASQQLIKLASLSLQLLTLTETWIQTDKTTVLAALSIYFSLPDLLEYPSFMVAAQLTAF